MKGRLSQINHQLQPQDDPKEPRKKKAKAEKQPGGNVPRGERGDFLKVTITLPPELLSALRNEGMKRKSGGQRDTDVSSLIREACTEWLNKQ